MNRTAARPASQKPNHDTAKLDAIVAAHLPQVEFLARRIHKRLPAHVPLEDLVNEGLIGLIDALKKFDPTRHVKFNSYAQFRIQGAILDSLRNLDWCSRELRKQARDVERARDRLTARLGRSVLREEVAAEAHMSSANLEKLLAEIHSAEVLSLQGIAGHDGPSFQEAIAEPAEPGEDPFELYLRLELREKLAAALAQLPERDRQILSLYYFEELTMAEIGEVFGVGESRVCQLHSCAVKRLRDILRTMLPACHAERKVS
jgi:RNA polymerase sigma factor for flagellar operon FliA